MIFLKIAKGKCIFKKALMENDNHYSFCSCLELGDDLKDMFPSNDIVSNFKLSKTKCVYLVIHGIAPWVKKKMCKLGRPTLHSTVCHLMSH